MPWKQRGFLCQQERSTVDVPPSPLRLQTIIGNDITEVRPVFELIRQQQMG